MVARLRQDDLEVVSTQPLQIKATVPVQPKVELGDYKALKIEATPAEVTDEQVDAVVTRLRESHATWEPVERAVESGDRVAIDVLAKAGETTVMESKDAEYVVDPRGPQPAEGFADAIVGMSAEESKTVTLKLPEEHRNKELAGQDADFDADGPLGQGEDPAGARRRAAVDGRHGARDRSTSFAGAIRENLSAREEHERRVAHEEKVVDRSWSRRRWSCRRSLSRRRLAASFSSLRRTLSARASRCRAIYVSHKRRRSSSGPR